MRSDPLFNATMILSCLLLSQVVASSEQHYAMRVMIVAMLPSLFMAFAIFRADRFGEPWQRVLTAFAFGVASPIVTLWIALQIGTSLPEPSSSSFMEAFLFAGLPEELGRLLIFFVIYIMWSDVDEPFDCIVYGAAIWAGFAGIENFIYAERTLMPAEVLSARAVLCSTLHTAWGVIIGTYLGMALFSREGIAYRYIFIGLALTVTTHTLYDGLLFAENVPAAVVLNVTVIMWAILSIQRMRRIQSKIAPEGPHAAPRQVAIMQRWRIGRMWHHGNVSRKLGLGIASMLLIVVEQFLVASTLYAVLTNDVFVFMLGAPTSMVMMMVLLYVLSALEQMDASGIQLDIDVRPRM